MDPCVLVASTSDSISSEQIVKGILKTEELPPSLDLGFGFASFPWTIDTKYYNADVRICTMGKQDIGTQEIADSVNAVVVSFDGHSLQPVDRWVAFTKEFDAEVKLLVCERCSSEDGADKTGVSKYQAQQWCIANGFELIELNPEPLTDQSDTEDDFPETVGMERIIQALHAHMWPNLELKASPVPRTTPGVVDTESSSRSPAEESKQTDSKVAMVKPIPGVPLTSASASKSNASEPSSANKAEETFPGGSVTITSGDSKEVGKVPPFRVDSKSSSQSTESAPTKEDPPAPLNQEASSRDSRIDSMLEALDLMPEDNFEQLFMNLSEMKTKASNLSPSARKSYAEKMAIAFWNSIGGDPSEIDGLSSDDES